MSDDAYVQAGSAKEARELGHKTYFTGKPCKNGHVDVRKVSDRGCRECSRERSLAWARANSEAHRERTKAWNRANPEYQKAWHLANREYRREKSKDWRETNPERNREVIKAWKEANPERRRLERHRRRAIARDAGSHSKEDLDRIWDGQRAECAECSCCLEENGHHLDHILPISKGGTNDPSNLQFLCPSCNLKKGAKHPTEWARENGRLL